MRRFIAFSILCFIFLESVSSQDLSSSVYRFLDINPNARAAALGGNHPVFMDTDFTMMSSNPAFLQNEIEKNLYASYINHIGDISFGAVSTAMEFDDIGTFGFGFRVLNYGDMNRYDETGESLGNLSANDFALSTGYGSSLHDHLHYGVALHLIYSVYDEFRSSAISGSAGILYTPDSATHYGLTVQHAGTQITTFNEYREPLPLNISAGVVHQLQYLPARIHVTLQRLNNWDLQTANDEGSIHFGQKISRHLLLGTEFMFGEYVTLRFGYDHLRNRQLQTGNRLDGAGLGMGIGIQLERFNLDFSRTSFSEMGNLIQLAITASL